MSFTLHALPSIVDRHICRPNSHIKLHIIHILFERHLDSFTLAFACHIINAFPWRREIMILMNVTRAARIDKRFYYMCIPT